MTAAAVRALMHADSRLLWRDPLVGWVLLMPFGVALLLRVLVPRAGDTLSAANGFDLAPYHPLIMGGYLMTAPGIVGMVIGFLLLDERDARTLMALRVTPLSMRRYLGYRIAWPLMVGTLATLAGYPLVGITQLPFTSLVPIAIVAGLWAPLLTLVGGWPCSGKSELATACRIAGFGALNDLKRRGRDSATGHHGRRVVRSRGVTPPQLFPEIIDPRV